MEIHRDLPFGLRLNIAPSHGTRRVYGRVYVSDVIGFGWNGANGHYISVSK